jgi:hypothetical protein
MEAVDGVIDSPRERFALDLPAGRRRAPAGDPRGRQRQQYRYREGDSEMTQTADRLARILAATPLRLADVSEAEASQPSAPGLGRRSRFSGT